MRVIKMKNSKKKICAIELEVELWDQASAKVNKEVGYFIIFLDKVVNILLSLD